MKALVKIKAEVTALVDMNGETEEEFKQRLVDIYLHNNHKDPMEGASNLGGEFVIKVIEIQPD